MEAASRQTGALFVGEKEPECLSPVVDCGPKAQYLEITIDVANPSVFPDTVPFTVYGRCNEGNYPYSGIRFRAYVASDPTDTGKFYDEIVKKEDYTGANYNGHCMNGRYIKEIPATLAGTAYILRVDMIGYTQTQTSGYYNSESMGSATIDFSFFDPTP